MPAPKGNKYAKGHPGVTGRPSKYRPEYAEQAQQLTKLGATDGQLADFFKVTIDTIRNWRVQHEDFFTATRLNYDIADQHVERTLYQRATGYEYQDFTFRKNAAGEFERIDFTRQMPPDTAAATFWLRNRQPKAWKERTEQEITGSLNVTVPASAPSDEDL